MREFPGGYQGGDAINFAQFQPLLSVYNATEEVIPPFAVMRLADVSQSSSTASSSKQLTNPNAYLQRHENYAYTQDHAIWNVIKPNDRSELYQDWQAHVVNFQHTAIYPGKIGAGVWPCGQAMRCLYDGTLALQPSFHEPSNPALTELEDFPYYAAVGTGMVNGQLRSGSWALRVALEDTYKILSQARDVTGTVWAIPNLTPQPVMASYGITGSASGSGTVYHDLVPHEDGTTLEGAWQSYPVSHQITSGENSDRATIYRRGRYWVWFELWLRDLECDDDLIFTVDVKDSNGATPEQYVSGGVNSACRFESDDPYYPVLQEPWHFWGDYFDLVPGDTIGLSSNATSSHSFTIQYGRFGFHRISRIGNRRIDGLLTE